VDGDRCLARDRFDGMTIRVVVADDQEIVRTGLRVILDAQPDITVAGEAADGRQAVQLAQRLRPELCGTWRLGAVPEARAGFDGLGVDGGRGGVISQRPAEQDQVARQAAAARPSSPVTATW